MLIFNQLIFHYFQEHRFLFLKRVQIYVSVIIFPKVFDFFLKKNINQLNYNSLQNLNLRFFIGIAQ